MIPGTTTVVTTAGEEEAARRRRVRRFGIGLLIAVLLLVAASVGYVLLFRDVLRDPELPPTVTSPANPRVLRFELGLTAAAVAGVVATWLWRRRGGRR